MRAWTSRSSRPLVALVGENGAGKTNVLEAMSLFMPGRGLRRAELADMARQRGTGILRDFRHPRCALRRASPRHRASSAPGLRKGPAPPGSAASTACRLPRPRRFAEYLRVVWLTPDLDALFRGPAGDRRRFLDRLVLAVDAEHGTRVNALERALRSRNRVLEENPDDRLWLDALEREVAELAIAVAAARRETVERLAALILDDPRRRNRRSPSPR